MFISLSQMGLDMKKERGYPMPKISDPTRTPPADFPHIFADIFRAVIFLA